MCTYKFIYTQSTLLLTQQISFNQNGVAVRITFNMLAFLFLLTNRFLRSNYCLNHGKIYKCRCPRPLLLTGCEGNTAGCWTVAKGTYPKQMKSPNCVFQVIASIFFLQIVNCCTVKHDIAKSGFSLSITKRYMYLYMCIARQGLTPFKY